MLCQPHLLLWQKCVCDVGLMFIQVGDIAEGTIQSIKPYGAFIDLGRGMSGLLHVSQISYDRITNVGAILSEGDKLKVCLCFNCTLSAFAFIDCTALTKVTEGLYVSDNFKPCLSSMQALSAIHLQSIHTTLDC